MMTVRPYESKDYSTAFAWWDGHGWEGVPAAVLPKLGLVAVHEEKPVAMAWLYLDNSTGVGMLEWIVTDPANPAKVSAVGIAHVVRCLREAAKDLGYGVILASCRQTSLVKLLNRCGFITTDHGVTHLISMNPVQESE
jgi:hypothetical protein